MVIALQYSVVVWLGWGVVRLVLAHHFSAASLASLYNSGPMFNSTLIAERPKNGTESMGPIPYACQHQKKGGEKTTHWLTLSGQSQLDIPTPWSL